MNVYIKLALGTGVPFGVLIALSQGSSSLPAAVIGGVVFGVLMSAIIGTFQLRADRAAEREAADHRRLREIKTQEDRDGHPSKPDR